MMKRAVGLFLIIPVILQAFGLTVFFFFAQYRAGVEMKTAMRNDPSNLVKIRLTDQEYRLSKVDKNEIRLNGKMYDIFEFIRNDEIVEVLAWHDTGEESILSLIEKMIGDGSQDKNNLPLKALKLIASNYTIPQDDIALFNVEVIFQVAAEHAFIYHAPSCENTTPPPERLS